MKVEFDRKALEDAMANGLKLNEANAKEFEHLIKNHATEASEEFDKKDATLNLAAIGAKYKIGPLELNNVLGNLILLAEIDSPFANGLDQGQELAFSDCAQALYVLAKGREVLNPIMEINQRIDDLMRLEDMVKTSPGLFSELLDRAEAISESRITFAQDAAAFYNENFTLDKFPEVLNRIVNIVIDFGKTIEDNPTPTEKKSS